LAIVAIIPARYASTRLPGKPLSDIHGKTLIQRVHERVRGATTLDRILVATDDERIAAAVRSFGGEVLLTSPHHPTGTDRLAEAARAINSDIVVNVQGDEPMLDPAGIDATVRALTGDPELPMATLSLPLVDVESISAGGGSIGWADARGMLRVGPVSAGAVPGPACYGKGGTEPAVTDALVVLGYVDPVW